MGRVQHMRNFILILLLCLTLASCAASDIKIQPKGDIVIGGGVSG